jgi:hypothetical protein
MLDIAETLDPLLDARARRVEQAELGLEDEDIDEYTAETTLQLIFFDGEEAFMAWTATDSIYGARSVPFLSSPPPLRSYVSPTFLSPTQTPRRNMGVDVPAPTSKAPPHLRLNTHNTPLRRPRQRRDAPP